MPRTLPPLALLALALLAGGCGSPPALSGAVPPLDSTLEAGRPDLELRFDRPLDPASVAALPPVLRQGEELLPLHTALLPGGAGLLLSPLADLRPGDAVVELPAGLRGERGRALPLALSLRWQVVPRTDAAMRSSRYELRGGRLAPVPR